MKASLCSLFSNYIITPYLQLSKKIPGLEYVNTKVYSLASYVFNNIKLCCNTKNNKLNPSEKKIEIQKEANFTIEFNSQVSNPVGPVITTRLKPSKALLPPNKPLPSLPSTSSWPTPKEAYLKLIDLPVQKGLNKIFKGKHAFENVPILELSIQTEYEFKNKNIKHANIILYVRETKFCEKKYYPGIAIFINNGQKNKVIYLYQHHVTNQWLFSGSSLLIRTDQYEFRVMDVKTGDLFPSSNLKVITELLETGFVKDSNDKVWKFGSIYN